MREKLTIGIGSGGKTIGHPHMGTGQPPDHLPEGRVLAPNPPYIVHPQMLEANRTLDHCQSLLPRLKHPSRYILPEGYVKIR